MPRNLLLLTLAVAAVVGLSACGGGGGGSPIAPPAAPTLISPATGASVTLPVTLHWTSVAGASTYVVQVSPNADFSNALTTTPAATTVQVTTLASGTTHYWRVAAKAGTLQGNWSTSWTFTTGGPPPPATPTLTAPANGATSVALPVTFQWTAVADATGYLLQVGQKADLSDAVTNPVSGTSLQLATLPTGTVSYWRVAAKVGTAQGKFSAIWSFTTQGPLPPATPTLTAPANGATLPLPVTLQWTTVTGATSYLVQLGRLADLSDATTSTSTGASTQLTTLSAGTTYYWRVAAKAGTLSGSYSATWSFTVGTPPSAPTLTAPANGATLPLPVTLQWTTVTGATSYLVQLGRLADLSDATTSTSTGASTQLTTLSAATTYYWRVAATAGTLSGSYSAIWSFTTQGSTSGAPTPTAPANGSSPEVPVTLTWTSVTGATSYVVETGKQADLSLGIETSASGSSLQFTNLPVGVTLYWRVAANTASGQGNWSVIWSFTPQSPPPPPPPPNPPTLVAPADGDSVTAPTTAAPLTFSWTTVTGATGYTVQVAQNSAFSPLLRTTSTSGTTWAVTSLPTGTLYWRVLATLSSTSKTAWSVVGSFKVVSPPPPPPPHDPQLVGTWEAVSATRDGTIVGVPTALDFTSGDYRTLQFQVSPAVAATVTTYHQGSTVSTTSGTWSTANGGGAGSYLLAGVTTNFTYSLTSPNLLNLTTTSGGHTLVTRWVKQVTLTGQDPNLDTTWVAVAAQRNGIPISTQDIFHLTYATNQQTVQFLAGGTEFRRELNATQERPIIYHLQSSWATGAGTLSFSPTHYSPQQSAYYTFGADGSLVTVTMDTTYGTTDVVTWNRWPVVAGTLPAAVVGIWQPTAVTVGGFPAPLATYLGWRPGTTSENFQFYPDGTLELREMTSTNTLNWAGLSSWYYLNGTLSINIGGTPATVQYSVAGSKLTLTESASLLGTIVYTLQQVP